MNESPKLLTPLTELPRPNQLDARIRRAEERFEAGKRLQMSGDSAGARREFDRAVDILLGAPDLGLDRSRLEKKLEELVERIHRTDLEGLGAAASEDAQVFDRSPLDDILEMTFPLDPRLKDKVKEELKATVSQLPLEENDAVLSYINYFSTDRGKRTVAAGIRRAGRYRDLILPILAEEGVPQEIIYLAQAESGFLPRAVSRKAATGMWQFVQWRGREYGLVQTAFTDDRLDPEKATRAAARHLRDLYTQFGDWYLAMAAYNCGPGCVDRAVQRTGYADFWSLRARNALPKETSNYVPIILAITIMSKNAKDYGLEDIAADPKLEYDTVEMEAATSLALVGDAVDRPVTLLRELNPALLQSVAPAGYHLRIPKGSGAALVAALEPVPASRRTSWRMHKVASGETLTEIAKRYRTPLNAIAAANNSGSLDPEPGDTLIIPATRDEAKASASKTASKRQTASRKPATSKSASSAARAPARTKTTASKSVGRGATYQTASLRTKKASAAR